MKINNGVIAITGASAGIGATTARLLASRRPGRAGCTARGRSRADHRRDRGRRRTSHSASPTLPGRKTSDGSSRAVERFGQVDSLVASAGVAHVGPLVEGKLTDWDTTIDVNLRGVLHGIAAALPTFTAQGSGHFVIVTSTAAAKWVPGQVVYAATKAGVRALCEILRQEVGPEIRATMVCPGATATEFTTDPELRERMAAVAMAPSAVAEAIAYALAQPVGVTVGEIVVRSAAQP
jgi:NADP-dependent 3-hydroxy acid dehydrogenase YdfG